MELFTEKSRKTLCFLVIALTFILCIFVFAGCAGNGTADESTAPDTTVEETAATVEYLLCEDNKSNYKVVMPEKCSGDVKDAAIAAFSAIGSFKTDGLKMIYDNYGEGQDPAAYEIVVGSSARDGLESVKSQLKMPHDYIITAVGNKIFIYSDDDAQVLAGANAFAELIKTEGTKKTLTLTGGFYHSYEYPAAGMTVCGSPVSEYSIVYAEGGEDEKELAESLRTLIYENTGYTLPLKSSGEAATDREILIGNCSRGVEDKYFTGSGKLDSGEYALETSGTKFICAFGAGAKRVATEKITEIFSMKTIENVALRDVAQLLLSSLDGKKVLFLGNSHTYYGGCVTTARGENSIDTGWFYQIARTFGEKVTVVNMTYGGAKLTDLYPKLTPLSADWFEQFDAVIVQNAGTANDATALSYARKIRELFPADTIFAYVIFEYCVRNNQTYTLNAAETLKNEGWLVADWGHTAFDLMDGKVEGLTHSYPVTTFRVNKNDTFHPNPLSGYITALTCYGTLTGKKIEGSDYSFIKESYLKSFISTYYNNASDTNIIEIFADADEIRRIQAVVDKRVAEVNGR